MDLGDVILLDQRGGGRSRPALARQVKIPPPTTVMYDPAANEEYLVQASRDVDLPPLRFIPVEEDPGDLGHPSLGN